MRALSDNDDYDQGEEEEKDDDDEIERQKLIEAERENVWDAATDWPATKGERLANLQNRRKPNTNIRKKYVVMVRSSSVGKKTKTAPPQNGRVQREKDHRHCKKKETMMNH